MKDEGGMGQTGKADTQHAKTLGIAVAGGGGGIGRGAHLPAITQAPGVRLVAVCDADAQGLAQVAAEYNVDVYSDLDRVLARDDVDIVDVCTPDNLHAEHTIAAARAGKHVLCEKPFALEVADAVAMRDAAQAAGVKLMCAMCKRWRPDFMRIKQLIDDGAVGRVVYVCRRGKGAFYPYPQGSIYRRAESKGQFGHNGPHFLDLMAWFADALPVAVYAPSRSPSVDDEARLQTDNYTSAMYRFDSGAIGWAEQNLMMLNPRGFQPREVYTVIGTDGMLTWDSRAASTIVRYKGGSTTLSTGTEAGASSLDSFTGEIAHFADCVRGDSPLAIPIDHTIRILAACLAALDSAATGQPVRISNIE